MHFVLLSLALFSKLCLSWSLTMFFFLFACLWYEPWMIWMIWMVIQGLLLKNYMLLHDTACSCTWPLIVTDNTETWEFFQLRKQQLQKDKDYHLSTTLAAFILSMMITCLFLYVAEVNVMPRFTPGDLGISTSNGPEAFVTESKNNKHYTNTPHSTIQKTNQKYKACHFLLTFNFYKYCS